MNILVLGASGNIGSSLVKRLGRLAHNVSVLVRSDSAAASFSESGVQVFKGDLEDSEAIKPAMENVDVVINTSYIVFARNILRAALESSAGVKRILYIGSTGIYTSLPSRSASNKRSAEEMIRNSSIPYTILRPTMVYGTAGDRNIFRLISFLYRFKFFPVFGNGENLMQPVYINDVIEAIISALNTPGTIRKSYDIGGRDAITYNDLIDTTALKLGKKIKKLHLPMGPSLWLARVAKGRFPVSEEQILRLNENKDVEISAASCDFGYKPISFNEGVEKEVDLFLEMKKNAV